MMATITFQHAALRAKRLAAMLLTGTALASLAGDLALAGGLSLPAQSTGALAHAFGGVAVSATPSTSYYNPAGMVLINGDQGEGDLNFYDINSNFTGSDTAINNGAPGSAKNFVESTLVPGNFGVNSLPDGLKLGFSVTTPIGGRIKFAPNFVGQYQGTEALLTTVQLGVDLAIPITRKLSIGFGPEINLFQDYLSQNVNLAPFPPASGEFRGQGYGFGYDVGLMYQFSPSTRIGLNYRSKISQKIKGVQAIYLPASLASLLATIHAGPPAFSSASDRWTFPQQVTFGVYQQVTSRLAVMASVQWTNWVADHALIITDPSTIGFTGGSIYTPFNNHNTWTLGLGANYAVNSKLTLMGGVGYDESPTSSATRNDLLPDANRTEIGAGLTYQVLKFATVQMGYQHIFLAPGAISQTRVGLSATNQPVPSSSGTLTGNFNLSVNAFSTGLIIKF